MAYVYFTCVWTTQWDKVDIDLIFTKLNVNKCEIALFEFGSDNDGNQTVRIGLKAHSVSDLQKIVQDIGQRYGAISWQPMTEEEYSDRRGKRISNHQKDRKHIYETVHSLVGYNRKSYELLHELETENGKYQIYTIDCLITDQTKTGIWDLLTMADKMSFILTFAQVKDKKGYLYWRFFSVVSSLQIMNEFIDAIAKKMGLVDWKKVGREALPNIVRFDPRKTTPANLISKWGEMLAASASHNEKLRRINNETD